MVFYIKFIFIVFIFLFSHAYAESFLPVQWGAGPIIVRKNDQVLIRTKIFSRYLNSASLKSPLAQTIYTHFDSKTENVEDSIQEISKKIKTSFTPVPWLIKESSFGENGRLISMEGAWKKANRNYYIHLFKEKKFGTGIIVTSIRLGFNEELSSEVNRLHTLLFDSYKLKHGEVKTSFVSPIVNAIFPMAHAQSITGIMSMLATPGSGTGGTGTGGVGTISDITTSVNALNSTLGISNTNWADTNTQLQSGNTNFNNTNEQLGTANTNWAEMNQQLHGINSNWDATNTQLSGVNTNLSNLNSNLAETNNQFAGMNKNWEKTNELAALALDPEHMFQVGFASAAGATLGALTVNLLIDGVVKGIGMLADLILDTAGKKDRWEKFKIACEQWDKQTDSALELEKYLDLFLKSFATLEKLKGEDLLVSLEQSNRELEFRTVWLKKQLDQPKLEEGCAREIFVKYKEIDDMTKKVAEVIKFAKDQNIKTVKFDDNTFCNQLADIKRKIVQSENMLNRMRFFILNGQGEWRENKKEQIEKNIQDLERIKNLGVQRNNNELDKAIIMKLSETNPRPEEKIPSDWLDKCVHGQNQSGLKISNGKPYNWFDWLDNSRRENECKKTYIASYIEAYGRKEQDKEKLAKEASDKADALFEESKSTNLTGNQNAEIIEINVMLDWFRKLNGEAYCFEQLETKNKKIEQKCNNVSAKMVSLHHARENAEVAWDSKCAKKMDKVYKDLYTSDLE